MACPDDAYEPQPDSTCLDEHILLLSGQIGPRPFGSQAEERAGQYIAQTLKQYGAHITRQTFTCRPYEHHSKAEIAVDTERRLITCVPYLPLFFRTSNVHLCSSLVLPGMREMADKIVILPSANFLPLDRLYDYSCQGSVGALTYYRFAGPLIKQPQLRDYVQQFGAFMHRWQLPVFLTSEEDGHYLEAVAIQSHRFTLSLSLSRPLRLASNIIGKIGAGEPAVILLAHHDSDWTVPSPGASDNASGVAVLLEVARILASRHRNNVLRLKGCIQFASFAAEEYFRLGSLAYFFPRLRRWLGRFSPWLPLVLSQMPSRKRNTSHPLTFVINLDSLGKGQLFTIAVARRNEVIDKAIAIALQAFSTLGNKKGDIEYIGEREDLGDCMIFSKLGYPVVSITSAGPASAMYEHSTGDRYERLDLEGLPGVIAFVCALVQALLS